MTTGIHTFCDKLIVFGNDFPRIGPESARSDFGIPDRMQGGVLEGTPHKYFVAPASFHLSVWNPAGDA